MLAAVSASAAGFQCVANSGVPPTIRADGLAELAGDLVLNCAGGTPTPAGQAFPQFNFTILLNTNVTSKITGQNQFSEGLLIVDDPASATNPTRQMLNCGNNGAPDNGASGAGVCASVSPGSPITSYDGTPNGFGAAACDGAGGRPAANTYGCGRPNVFQGRIGTPSSPGQLNAITFFNVPVDPPGGNTTRRFRFTNVRVNAASVGLAPFGAFYLTSVQATVAATGPIPITISGEPVTIAYLGAALLSNSSSCTASAPSRIRVCEGYGQAWKPRNISFATGNGVAGNASISGSYWAYNGRTNDPPDVAQNSPGAIYNTESGLEWQNNSANGPPSPDPPFGLGTVEVTATTAPLSSVGFSGVNTGISGAGVANAGTRIALRFAGIPSGASVQVPTVVSILPTGNYGGGGVMVLTNTDSSGAGAFSPAASGTLSGDLAVYEVLWADPFSIEYAEVPYTLINAPPGATVQVSAGFAPFYSDSGSQQPESAAYPVPRFLDSINECGGQSCLNVSPNQGLNAGPVRLTFTYYGGSTDLTGAQVLLRATGSADILGTNLSSPATNELVATFNLAGAPLGARDVVISPGLATITLAGGFSILQSPDCAYSVAPQSIHAPASGGSGSLVVNASVAQCSWAASTTSSWITLPVVSSSLPTAQPYTIAPNTSSQLTGTITIAGESIPVTQDSASTCTYAINPGSASFGVNGGTFAVNVTTAPGCAWSTSSSLSWVFLNGSAGSGNGSVTIELGANTVGLLSGTLMIAGQPFAVSQDASACGGTDVSRQVSVSVQAELSPWAVTNFENLYNLQAYQQMKVTNQGAALTGQVSVVLYGTGCSAAPTLLCPFLALPNSYTPALVHCGTSNTYPVVVVSQNGLASSETVFSLLGYGSVNGGPLSLSVSVINGTPGP